MDANHTEISKPQTRESLLYRSVALFLREIINKAREAPLELADYMAELESALRIQFPPTALYFPLTLRLTKPSTAVGQPTEITPDASVTILLKAERRIYLRGVAGAGKSRLLGRLARELFSHSQIPIFLNLKSWTRSDSEFLDAQATKTARERFDVLLRCSIVGMTMAGVILADGLNEVYGGARSAIVRALDDWVRSQHEIEPAVVITDRLAYETRLFDMKWAHYEIQPLSTETVKEQIAFYLGQDEAYHLLTPVDRELLSSPYFLESVLRSGKLALGSAAKALGDFFTKELNISGILLGELAHAAFTVMEQYRSLSFPRSCMQNLSEGSLERLLGDGILMASSHKTSANPLDLPEETLHFDHQLKHDYLAALILAQDSQKWNRDIFDILTFKGASFNTLAMALQMMPSPADGDRFLELVYDWSWPGALICLAEAAKTGTPAASEGLQWMLLGLGSEKLFDSLLPTRTRARRLFEAFDQPPGSLLKGADSWAEAAEIISGLQSNDRRFLDWRESFLSQDSGKSGKIINKEEIILGIRDPQSIRGWTPR